jgi:hypothetical protein
VSAGPVAAGSAQKRRGIFKRVVELNMLRLGFCHSSAPARGIYAASTWNDMKGVELFRRFRVGEQ